MQTNNSVKYHPSKNVLVLKEAFAIYVLFYLFFNYF